MPHSKLILTPSSEAALPPTGQVVESLSAIGLTRDTRATDVAGQAAYLAGDRFLQLITFLGCSPFVRLEQEHPDDSEFSHIRIRGPFAQPLFRSGPNTTPPRCPVCRHRYVHWGELAEQDSFNCEGCGTNLSMTTLNWRQSAGTGRLFIEIWGVFPGEAVPSAELISALESLGCRWDYFYLQE
jgi:hypothetical protein